MTIELFIGERTYSSWSLRGWLLFERFGIERRETRISLYDGRFRSRMRRLTPAVLLPAIRTDEGELVGDTLAIAETLAELYPDKPIWPSDWQARQRARWLAAEIHSGMLDLRRECPMNLSRAFDGFVPSAGVVTDLERIDTIWSAALERFGGPWLCGDYSAADAFYAPVAARIAGYDLPVGAAARAYAAAHLADPAFRRWRSMALTERVDPEPYPSDLPTRPWPGPAPIDAVAVAEGPAENAHCPYSGKSVTHFMRSGARTFGFCNAFCRDKTVNDPTAWPAFMEIYHS